MKVENVKLIGLSQAQAKERLQAVEWDAIREHFPDALQIEMLHATTKSQVFLGKSHSSSAVIKLHRDQEALERELLALTVLRDSAPTLFAFSPHVLVLEYLPHEVDFGSKIVLSEAFALLGTVHSEMFKSNILGLQDRNWQSIADLIECKTSDDEFLSGMVLTEFGPGAFCAVGDLKEVHFRKDVNWNIKLIDLETIVFNHPFSVDLMMLIRLARKSASLTAADWHRLLEAYCERSFCRISFAERIFDMVSVS